MKINTSASRDAVRERYGSVREFARQCLVAFSMTNIDTAYTVVGCVLRGRLGASEGVDSTARKIRERLDAEGLVVYDDVVVNG